MQKWLWIIWASGFVACQGRVDIADNGAALVQAQTPTTSPEQEQEQDDSGGSTGPDTKCKPPCKAPCKPPCKPPNPTKPPNLTDSKPVSVAFTQYAGSMDHRKKQGDTDIGGGEMLFHMTPGEVRVAVTGMSSPSKRSDVRDAVTRMNGETVYTRILQKNLPRIDRYQVPKFLVFANSVTKGGNRFWTNAKEFFPVTILSGGAEKDFEPLQNPAAQLRYPVTFNWSGGGSFITTVVVRRIMEGGSPCGEFTGFTPLVADSKQYFGVKIDLEPPPPRQFADHFPFGTTAFVNLYQAGGTVTRVGSCKLSEDKFGPITVMTAFWK